MMFSLPLLLLLLPMKICSLRHLFVVVSSSEEKEERREEEEEEEEERREGGPPLLLPPLSLYPRYSLFLLPVHPFGREW